MVALLWIQDVCEQMALFPSVTAASNQGRLVAPNFVQFEWLDPRRKETVVRRLWLVVLAVIVVLGLVAPNAIAQGKGKGRGAEKQEHKKSHADDIAKHKDKDKDKDRDDDRWERREGWEYRLYGDRDSRPPGWSRGKKTGWGNCGVPPGQAKKGECRTYTYQGHRYYYYRDDDGRLTVRRRGLGDLLREKAAQQR